MDILPVFNRATWEAKVVFALGVADGVIGRLSLAEVNLSAVDLGWAWIESRAVGADDLYNQIEEISTLAEREDSPQRRSGLCAVGTAMYYVSWHAFRIEYESGQSQAGDIPNDMADITDDVLLEISDYTQEALADADELIGDMMNKLASSGLLDAASAPKRIERSAFIKR